MENKTNSKTNIISILAVIGLVIVSVLLIVKHDSDKNEVPHSMSVTGTSELTVSPDEAVIMISIITEAAQADLTQSRNKDITGKVIEALKNLGVNAKDIETSNYYLSRKSEWNPEKMISVETNYTLTHTLKVTTNDIQDVGKYVDAAVNAGANGIDSVTFTLSKEAEQKVRSDALIKATKAAKDKADSLASTAGVKIDKITQISESNFYYSPYNVNYGSNAATYAKADSAQITPQKVDVTASIQITYELEDDD